MKLWEWAVAAYDRPEVADACLKLQDSYGQNVPFLLWALWARPDQATLKQGRQIAKDWDRTVTWPLRAIRRELKGSAPHEELRADIKAAELKAERALLEALEPLAKPAKGEVLEALTAASTAWGAGAAAPTTALRRLAAAVSAIQAEP